ncbi:MAG: ABC transporter ATP-binding protein [Actinobacteria bacterium]|jgi:peptide/nickel transport system ATP-binding protein|nr:ABC transporter ATP-binding protein [Actinomycetota bacterium]NCW94405.1 ABC transporter ATP-binding protein [Actinomycetota bacterium]NCX35907.1 ABC transporter ATP-binding protein [Actinomycetota bacterium]
MSDCVLQVRDLRVGIPTDDGVVHAVQGVSFDLHRGEVLGIVGESGCGKTMTNLAIMGLLPPSAKVQGSVKLQGNEVLGLRTAEMRPIRGKRISMVFQDPMTSLNPVYSVGSQIVETLLAHESLNKQSAWARAKELLHLVGIPNASERAASYPHEFSGGMRQRVVIAIAIANNPDILICDEPTTALDVTVQAQILETLRNIRKQLQTAMIFITHDLGVMAGIADRLVVMYAGKIVETGSVFDIFERAKMPYTLGLLGSVPSEDSRGGRLNQIDGAPPSLVQLYGGCQFAPRCPLAIDICKSEGPNDVVATDGHHAACLRTAEIVDRPELRLMFRKGVAS